MEKIDKAISNSGPLIHLAQINAFEILNTIKNILIPDEVFREVCSFPLPGAKHVRESKIIKVKQLTPKSKDLAKIISERYSLGLGEAESVSLAIQEKIKLFLTDDLEARFVAKRLGLKPHGTIGLVLRSYKTGFIKKEKAIKIIEDIHKKSSLFLTSDLVNYIIKKIKKIK